jgi:hypothetical protein
MNFSSNATHIIGYNGAHLSGNSGENVGVIYFNWCNTRYNLTIFPKGFSNFFPNLIAFSMLSCSIDFLNGDELDEHPHVQLYEHTRSNLTRVPGRFFASTPNLKRFHFGGNKIQHVGEGLLDHLENLESGFFTSNICINQGASNPSEIPALIETLRQNCPDIEPDTTTTLSTTQTPTQGTFSTTQGASTTNQPPRCEIDDLEDFVCGLDEEIENLKETDEKLKAKNEILEGQVEDLNERNEVLEDKVVDLKENVETLRQNLLELEQMVIDLTTRPCAC